MDSKILPIIASMVVAIALVATCFVVLTDDDDEKLDYSILDDPVQSVKKGLVIIQ